MKGDLVNMRLAYGRALVELGRTHPDVVVLSADVSNSDHSYMFEEAFPDRFFNVGIAEQCLVDVALRQGTDLTLTGAGMMLDRCLKAAETLSREGIEARVIEIHTIKPLDAHSILQAAQQTGAIVTVEEHSVVGGLGAAVAEVVTEGHPVPVQRVGIADQFAETGPYHDLLDHYGMSQKEILRAARRVLAIKKKVS